MQSCSPFKQLVLIFGLMILSSQGAIAAAPLCSQILMSSLISESSIQITIDRIAEFKMDLDLAQAHGDTTTLHRLFDLEYDKKISLLSESLRYKISEHELHDMIAEKIRRLQRDREQAEKDNAQIRADQREMTARYNYLKKIDLHSDGAANALTYLSSRDELVFTDSKSRKLMLIDLQKNDVLPLQKDVIKYFVLPDENSILILSTKGNLSLLDLNSKETSPLTGIQVQTHHLQDVNPTGKVFATADNTNNQLVLIDIVKGQHHPIKINLPDPPKAISAVKFINDQEILISRFMEQFFYKINIGNGKVEVIDAGPQVIEGIHVSPDQQNLIFHSKKSGLITIKASELNDLKNRLGHQVGVSISNLSFMPNGKKLLIIYRDETLQRAIFGSEQIRDPYFSFPESMNSIDPMIITNPTFDGKNKRIFFPNVTKDKVGNKQYHIEIWQQEP